MDSSEMVRQLEELAGLHAQGTLTAEECAAAEERLLRITATPPPAHSDAVPIRNPVPDTHVTARESVGPPGQLDRPGVSALVDADLRGVAQDRRRSGTATAMLVGGGVSFVTFLALPIASVPFLGSITGVALAGHASEVSAFGWPWLVLVATAAVTGLGAWQRFAGGHRPAAAPGRTAIVSGGRTRPPGPPASVGAQDTIAPPSPCAGRIRDSCTLLSSGDGGLHMAAVDRSAQGGRHGMPSGRAWPLRLGVVAVVLLGAVGCGGSGSTQLTSRSPTPSTTSSSANATMSPTVTASASTGQSSTGQSAPAGGASQQVYLADMRPVNGYVSTDDAEVNGKPLAHTVLIGVGDEVEYNLGRQWRQLQATVGLRDDSGSSIQVRFEAFGDGRPLYSRVFMLGQSEQINLDVTEVLRLRLVNTVTAHPELGSTAAWGSAHVIG